MRFNELKRYLTAKQKKGLNGKMSTYNLSKPMTYEEFKAMPDDLRKEYITKLYCDWGVGLVPISNMFRCSPETVRQVCKQFGISTTGRQHLSDEQKIKWLEFLGKISTNANTEDEDEDESKEEYSERKDSSSQKIIAPAYGEIIFKGSMSEVTESMNSMLAAFENYDFVVTVQFKNP